MKRRDFLIKTSIASMAIGLGGWMNPPKTHILTLSFDDGFKKSFYKIAEIHESFGLSACLNIIASAHAWQNHNQPNNYHSDPVGNFDDWNKLHDRGHEIMPHSWTHDNLTELTFGQAKDQIHKCLQYFETHLAGFQTSESVYNFAYNASTPELEAYVLKLVKVIRTGGWYYLRNTMINPYPTSKGPRVLGCWSFGPDNADAWVEETINKFLGSDGGWLIINLHGLDDEGWGPLSSSYLDSLLKRLVKLKYLEILPTGKVADRYIN